MHEHTKDVRKGPVRDIMTADVATVHPETSIHDLLERFEEHERAAFPVVDDNDRFLGDVHERDLIKLAISLDDINEHEIIGYMGTTIDDSFFAETVEDIMEQHEITAAPDDTVEDVVLEMWNEDVRAVPVIEDQEIIGMVYEKDVIENVVTALREGKD